jgi:hypothetical protein
MVMYPALTGGQAHMRKYMQGLNISDVQNSKEIWR